MLILIGFVFLMLCEVFLLKVWLVFEFEDEQYSYNMQCGDVAPVCDDLSTDLTEHVPIYWYNHQKKQYMPVSVFTKIER